MILFYLFIFFSPQGGYLFSGKFLQLSSKMEAICKQFSVLHSTKLAQFTNTVSVYFLQDGYVFRRFTVVVALTFNPNPNLNH